MAEYDWALSGESKARILRDVMENRKLPDFGREIERISFLDGCKVYFRDSWIIVRFSGTEPRVRIFAEAPTMEEARALARIMADAEGLDFADQA
jgi:phosphomannomutase